MTRGGYVRTLAERMAAGNDEALRLWTPQDLKNLREELTVMGFRRIFNSAVLEAWARDGAYAHIAVMARGAEAWMSY